MKYMQTMCHLSVLVHEQAKKYGNKTALNFRQFGGKEWKSVSWNQFSLRVKQVSNALLNLGVKPKDNIGVFSQNCIQYLYTDFGAFGVKAVTIPLYATSSEQQVQFVANDAEIKILFVGEQDQYDKVRRIFQACSSLEKIIIYDRRVKISEHDTASCYFEDFIKMGESLPRQSEVEALYASASYDDICNILYTSGTTGEPKGVMLAYSQYYAAFEANGACVPVGEKDKIMNFLPYTHVFERGWTFFAMSTGAEFIINTNPKEILDTLKETRPTCMCTVPRFWEKVYSGIYERLSTSGKAKQALFEKALRVGKKYQIDCLSRGKTPSPWLALQYKFFDKTVFKLVRKELGFDNANFFPTAGSTIPEDIEVFIHSIGLYMMAGYGLTESLATVSCNHKNKPYTVGSIGIPVHNIEVKIAENNEICLKGETITKGYYKRDDATKDAFDEEGFFKTGDAGYLHNGELFLTERIKDMFKTSNGKYIAPQAIEAKMLVDKYIDQIAIIADQRKYVSALIVPDFLTIEAYAKENNIKYASKQELCNNPKIQKLIELRIETIQQGLAGYERIKKFTLLENNFTLESGELTNTLKIKRNVIYNKYSEVIDKMYEE